MDFAWIGWDGQEGHKTVELSIYTLGRSVVSCKLGIRVITWVCPQLADDMGRGCGLCIVYSIQDTVPTVDG